MNSHKPSQTGACLRDDTSGQKEPDILAPPTSISLGSLLSDIKKYKDSNPNQAELALKKLMKACSGGLIALAYREKENAGPRYDAEQMANRAFTLLYQKINTIKLDEKLSVDEQNQRIWGWLATTLKSQIIEFRRKKAAFFDNLKKLPRPPDWDTLSLRDRIRRKMQRKPNLVAELSKLSQDDKILVYISAFYFDEDDQKCKIPKKKLEVICKRLNTTKENLRQRRKRLFKRLQDAVGKYPVGTLVKPPTESASSDDPIEEFVNDFLGDDAVTHDEDERE